MKRSFTLTTLAILSASCAAYGQSLTINGTSYAGYFGPAGNVTVTAPTIPDNTLLSVTLGGSASGPLGTYWDVSANGGAVLGSNPLGILPEVRVAETGAQVSLDNSALNFNISNSPSSILGSLGVGTSLGVNWDAVSKFDVGGNQLVLAPNTTYSLSFDVNGSNGLLNSTLGIAPTFTVRLLDGAGTAVGTATQGTLVNIIGLDLIGAIGSPPGSGRATVEFTTGNTVGAGAASLEFAGSATLPATALNIGTNFASISNVAITTVPEASTFAFAILGGALAMRRRR